MEKKSSVNGGIGFIGLLTIVFIALKLTGVIAWPWIWVLAPIWISAVVAIGVLIAVLTWIVAFTKINKK